jgi:hypothetical protein
MLRCRQGPARVASARSRGSGGETLDAIRLAHNDRGVACCAKGDASLTIADYTKNNGAQSGFRNDLLELELRHHRLAITAARVCQLRLKRSN